jgi:hypothetical protein
MIHYLCLLLLTSVWQAFAENDALKNDADDNADAVGNNADNEHLNVVQHHRRPIHVGPLLIAKMLHVSTTSEQHAATLPSSSDGHTTRAMASSLFNLKPVRRCDLTDRVPTFIVEDRFYVSVVTVRVRDVTDAPAVVETEHFCFHNTDKVMDDNERVWVECWPCDLHFEQMRVRYGNVPAAIAWMVAALFISFAAVACCILVKRQAEWRPALRRMLRNACSAW